MNAALTIESFWKAFCARQISRGVSQAQLRESETAFYSGAVTMYDIMMIVTDPNLDPIEACGETLVDALVGGKRKRSKVRVDGEVIAHRVAFHQPAHTAYIVARCFGESHFRTAYRREIRLHRDAACRAESI